MFCKYIIVFSVFPGWKTIWCIMSNIAIVFYKKNCRENNHLFAVEFSTNYNSVPWFVFAIMFHFIFIKLFSIPYSK